MTARKEYFWPWAIDLGHEPPPGAHRYAGPYSLGRIDGVKPWQRGMTIGTFRTRAAARESLKRIRKTWKKARIVRLNVLIEEIDNG